MGKEVLNVVGLISIFVHNWQSQQGGKPCIYVFENWKTNAHSTTFENVIAYATTTNLTLVLLLCVVLISNDMDVQVVG
jgi:hypothetical protein